MSRCIGFLDLPLCVFGAREFFVTCTCYWLHQDTLSSCLSLYYPVSPVSRHIYPPKCIGIERVSVRSKVSGTFPVLEMTSQKCNQPGPFWTYEDWGFVFIVIKHRRPPPNPRHSRSSYGTKRKMSTVDKLVRLRWNSNHVFVMTVVYQHFATLAFF